MFSRTTRWTTSDWNTEPPWPALYSECRAKSSVLKYTCLRLWLPDLHHFFESILVLLAVSLIYFWSESTDLQVPYTAQYSMKRNFYSVAFPFRFRCRDSRTALLSKFHFAISIAAPLDCQTHEITARNSLLAEEHTHVTSAFIGRRGKRGCRVSSHEGSQMRSSSSKCCLASC